MRREAIFTSISTRNRALAAASVVALVATTPAFAQPAADEAANEIIVIGTPGGAGTDRQDASFAVTAISADDIEKIAPSSTADLLKSIPGVWVESSGGIAGANIDVRGLPGGGDAPFVTFAINGSPIFGTETLSFFEQSSIFRIDETVAGAEGLRGGPNAVFGKGEPGLTVNFNLKEGGEETKGRIKYTGSDYGLQRYDAFLSGKLDDNLYYAVGGYFRASHGIRDTQFRSEEGYQVTGNLTRKFENGKIDLFARATDDHGQWVLPQALNSGNDPGTFAQLGNATRFREIQIDPAGSTEVFDFSRGRGWKGVVAGGSADFDLGAGWTVRDKFTVTSGDANTFGFVPAGGAVTAAALSAVIGGPVATASGRTLDPTDFVQTYGHWVVLKRLKSFINDASVEKEFYGHKLTGGYYQATWSSRDTWYLGNPLPVQNIQNGEPLASSITPSDIAAAGGDAGFSFGLRSSGDATSNALYIADSWQVTDRLRLDAGARREWTRIDYTLDTGPGYADGTTDLAVNLRDAKTAWTGAINYDLTKTLGLFARYSNGFVFPHFDRIREGNQNVDRVEQTEGGVKFTSEYADLYGTFFYNTNDSFDSVVGGGTPSSAFTTRAYGVEVDGALRYRAFTTSVNATVQNPKVTNSTIASDIGNRVLRQPRWQVRVSPSYSFDVGALQANVYGAASFVGQRFNDLANSVVLPSYTKIDLGGQLTHPSGLFLQVHADNLNNSAGLTEGDPRNPLAPNGRPIFGRSVMFTVGYDF